MNQSSFSKDLIFNDQKVTTSVILESVFSKEIRILMKAGQAMKAHQTPYPIAVHVLEGEIRFGVTDKSLILNTGDIISLEGSVPHDLHAHTDSVVRLSLSKLDKAERVEKVVNE